ncbi:MAG: hypothetical protein ACYC35_27480 [Pirellulales bacterium]
MSRTFSTILFFVAGVLLAGAQVRGQSKMKASANERNKIMDSSDGIGERREKRVWHPGHFPEPPALLVQGQEYFVHSFTGASGSTDRLLFPGVTISHVSRKTGKMQFLVNTGVFSLATARRAYLISRVIGIAHDTQRLYVLTWEISQDDQPPPISDRGQVRFHVFRLADGSLVMDIPLRAGVALTPGVQPTNLPTGVPESNMKSGPIEMRRDGVACYGIRFTFTGNSIKQEADHSGEKSPAPGNELPKR